MQAFHALFGFPQVARVLNRVAFTIGQERFETHVNAHVLASGGMLNETMGLHGKLTVVAIGTLE